MLRRWLPLTPRWWHIRSARTDRLWRLERRPEILASENLPGVDPSSIDMRHRTRRGRLWVTRDRVEPAASPAMSAKPPKAEVNSRLRDAQVGSG
jgi:hypothetical protein